MTTQAIAKLLHDNRQRSVYLSLPPDLRAALGPDGLREALRLRWIVGDESGSFLRVNSRADALQEMARLAEFAAPGSGQPDPQASSQGVQPDPKAPRLTPKTNPTGSSSDYTVGEDVVIAQEGKTFQAKVSARNQDGTYSLTFGGLRPASNRNYRREEISRITSQ